MVTKLNLSDLGICRQEIVEWVKTESFSSTQFPVICRNIRIHYLIAVSFRSKRFHSRTFDNSAEILLPISRILLRKVRKWSEKFILFKKLFFPKTSRWTRRRHFWQTRWNCFSRKLTFLVSVRKWLKSSLRLQKPFSLKVFPWTLRLNYWQPSQKICRQRWILFSPKKSEND